MSHEVNQTTKDLLTVLQRQTRELEDLAKIMAQNRDAFISTRAPQLLDGLSQPAANADRVSELETRRQELTEQLAGQIELKGDFRVSRVAPMLPSELGKRLLIVSRQLDKAARQVRTEAIVGQRLLRLSEITNAGILEALVGARVPGVCYDAHAQAHGGIRPGGSDMSGSLISGTA